MNAKLYIKIEQCSVLYSEQLILCLKRILIQNPPTRAGVAAIVQRHGFAAHVGGQHVAIIVPEGSCSDAGMRLAIITGDTADFN